MSEHCPICDTELLGDEYCPKCKRCILDEKLKREVQMLKGAITGWSNMYQELQMEVRKLLMCFDEDGKERVIPDYIIQNLKELTNGK